MCFRRERRRIPGSPILGSCGQQISFRQPLFSTQNTINCGSINIDDCFERWRSFQSDWVVEYTYNAWGKLLSTIGSLATTLGVKNPYRYRGYRFDTETGLYYLNSRYYDPLVGRFLNVDALAGRTGEMLGHNVFAYCENNPINMKDPCGYRPIYTQDEETEEMKKISRAAMRSHVPKGEYVVETIEHHVYETQFGTHASATRVTKHFFTDDVLGSEAATAFNDKMNLEFEKGIWVLTTIVGGLTLPVSGIASKLLFAGEAGLALKLIYQDHSYGVRAGDVFIFTEHAGGSGMSRSMPVITVDQYDRNGNLKYHATRTRY